jgi:hypothetical protein
VSPLLRSSAASGALAPTCRLKYAHTLIAPSGNADATSIEGSDLLRLSGNDRVRLMVFQNSTAALNLAGIAGYRTAFQCVKVSESNLSQYQPPWGLVAPALVAALPASPSDGQEVFYLADATAGIVWHLRYRAGSPNTHKWEFLGGAEMFGTANLNPSASGFPNGTWWDSFSLTNGGPFITAPLAGVYQCDFGARMWASVASISVQMGIFGASTTGVNVGSSQVIDAVTQSIAVDADHHASSWRLTVAAGESIRPWFAATTGAGPSYVNRWVKVRPVRVA